MERSLAELKIKEKAEELDQKGRGSVQAFKRGRDNDQKRKHFADAKAVRTLAVLLRILMSIGTRCFSHSRPTAISSPSPFTRNSLGCVLTMI
jgi:hypothetical protein